MSKLEKEVLRMELQVSELIRIVANLNERLKNIEETEKERSYLQKIPFAVHL